MTRFSLYTLLFTLIAVSALAESPSPPGAALLQDAASYAAQYGVAVDEAVRRLRLQREIGDLDALLVEEERATFAGLWIEHQPRYRVVARFTDSAGEARLRRRLAGGQLADLVETRSARWSLEQLEQQQKESRVLTHRAGIQANSDINVFENRVELHVLEPRKLHDAVASMRVPIPPAVEITRVERLARTEALIGGSPLSTCTAGFGVQTSQGELGVLTAGHCPDQQYFEGRLLPFRAQDLNGSEDVQWNSACDVVQVTNQFDSGVDLRPCIATRHRNSQVPGQFVCKNGKATGRTCGEILSRSYDPYEDSFYSYGTFVYVKSLGDNLSEEGDSGAPWFLEYDAYGIQVGAPHGGISRHAYYMPINFVSSLGVSVLTSYPPAVCNARPKASFTFGIRRIDGMALFDASASSDPDGRIVRYEWDFDDGTTSMTTTPTTSHLYGRETATYYVTLTVVDNDGNRASVNRQLTFCYPISCGPEY